MSGSEVRWAWARWEGHRPGTLPWWDNVSNSNARCLVLGTGHCCDHHEFITVECQCLLLMLSFLPC